MWQVMTMAVLMGLALAGAHRPHGSWSPSDQDGVLRYVIDQPADFNNHVTPK